MRPTNRCRFVWVGYVYPFYEKYKVYLRQQILSCGLEGRVTLMDEVTDLNPIYRRADAFLLSSRLDPLPNVAVDAAQLCLPIVCFEHAGGMAEFLANDLKTPSLVVPYL